MRRVLRRRLQRLDDHLLDLLVGDRPRAPRPRLIGQPIEAVLGEPVAPHFQIGGPAINRREDEHFGDCRSDVVGIECKRSLTRFNRCVRLVLLHEHLCQRHMQHGLVRVERAGTLQHRFRRIVPPLGGQRLAEPSPVQGNGRLQLDRTLEGRDGLLALPHLQLALAKQHPFFRVGWCRTLALRFGRNDRICRQQERRGGTGVRGFDYFPPSLGKALL